MKKNQQKVTKVMKEVKSSVKIMKKVNRKVPKVMKKVKKVTIKSGEKQQSKLAKYSKVKFRKKRKY